MCDLRFRRGHRTDQRPRRIHDIEQGVEASLHGAIETNIRVRAVPLSLGRGPRSQQLSKRHADTGRNLATRCLIQTAPPRQAKSNPADRLYVPSA